MKVSHGRMYHLSDSLAMLKKTRQVPSQKRRCLIHSLQPADSDPNGPEFWITKWVQELSSDYENHQIEAIKNLGSLLALENDTPPIQQVIQSGVLPRLVYFLERDDSPKLQFNAAWVITNIASGTLQQTQAVINSGAVPILATLLKSPNADVPVQAIWALGNIAGEFLECCEIVLRHNVLSDLRDMLNGMTQQMMEITTWAVSNFARGHRITYPGQIKPALEFLKHCIKSSDKDILSHTCLALSNLLEHDIGPPEEDIFLRLIELLNYPSHSVISPALCSVVNIFKYGNKEMDINIRTWTLIKAHGLGRLRQLLIDNSCTMIMKKKACWLIVKIMRDDFPPIQDLIDAKVFGPIICLLDHFELCKDAALAIKFVVVFGNQEQLIHLIEEGCIEPICRLLKSRNDDIVRCCLVIIRGILEIGDKYLVQMIEDATGWDKIRSLRNHFAKDISDSAKTLLAYENIPYHELPHPITDIVVSPLPVPDIVPPPMPNYVELPHPMPMPNINISDEDDDEDDEDDDEDEEND